MLYSLLDGFFLLRKHSAPILVPYYLRFPREPSWKFILKSFLAEEEEEEEVPCMHKSSQI